MPCTHGVRVMTKNKKFGGKKEKAPAKTKEQKEAEKRSLALWALLGNGGSGFGGLVKPVVEKAEREALAASGLVTFEKRKGGAYWLEVTDRGWRWAEEHLSDGLPERTQAGTFVLHAWLTRLQAFMHAHNIRLAEVLGPQAAHGRKRPTEPLEPTDYTALRERIRRAYLDVTGGIFNTRALLSDIREHLPDIDREALDSALKLMQRENDASLMQLDNRAEIRDADRAAALQIGNEPRHILWITR
jgi:hypothetical protein